ncbi:metalloprotease secretion chaperone CpaB [Acinetobacter rudis]|nr:metalloprotease secretion chaperone CpaB [Acinetobacter rudis]MDQ8954247.1 metalloprotease secretion chaperone CpaB [Acinetobacter rudis]
MYKLILIIVFAFSILLFWIQQLQSSTTSPVAVEPMVKHSQAPSQSASAVAVAVASRWNKTPQIDPLKPIQLFKPLSKQQVANDANFIFSKRLQQADSYPIAYAEELIVQRHVGDQVQFQVPELGIDVIGVINSLTAVDEDIHRWSGRILHSPYNLTFSILQSEKDHYSIVQLQTAQGLYVAEIKNGLGVIQADRVDLDHDQ